MTDTHAIAREIGAMKLWEVAGARPESAPPGLKFNRNGDELLSIPAMDYVRALTGAEIHERGRVNCPLPDHEDHSRDFSVVRESNTRWYCFGCNRGGSIYDFAAALWQMPDRGLGFIELHQRLVEALSR